jgi:hypothetical protein
MIRTRVDRKLSADPKSIDTILRETCQWYIECHKERYYTDASTIQTTTELVDELRDLLRVIGAAQSWISIKLDPSTYLISVQVNVSYSGFHSFGFVTSL